MNDEDDSSTRSEDSGFHRWWRRLAHSFSGGGPKTREELRQLLDEARESHLVDADAQEMFEGILDSAETQVRDVMIPRAQMVVVDGSADFHEIMRVVVESGHSRFPVIGESRDEVLGILLAKDLLRFSMPGFDAARFELQRVLRPPVFVPESKRLNVLLKDFRKSRNHMAIVVDEYSGVAGLVTIEDVLEQIVGDIDDEYDEAEGALILKQDERRYLINALTPIQEFNDYFQTEFPTEEFDTIGGLVLHHFGHMPKRGESVRIERFNFNVQRADSRRVHLFQVTVSPA